MSEAAKTMPGRMRTGPGITRERAQAGRIAPAVRSAVVVTVGCLTVFSDRLMALLLPPASGMHGRRVRSDEEWWSLPRWEPLTEPGLEAEAAACFQAVVGQGPGHLEQVRTWSTLAGEPVERTIEVGYLALVPQERALTLGGEPGCPQWWPLDELPHLLPPHADFLLAARQRLQSRLAYSGLASHLLPREFSLSDLQQVYEVIQGRPLDKRNFRKWVLAGGMVEATEQQRRDGAHRPARLYRFTGNDAAAD